MKWLLTLLLILLTVISFSNKIILFKNQAIFVREDKNFYDKLVVNLHNGEVLWVDQADYWKIIKEDDNFDFKIMRNLEGITLEPLIPERNIFKIVGGNYIIFYHPQLSWCQTREENLKKLLAERKLILFNFSGEYALGYPGNWNAEYELKNNRLSVNYIVKTKIPEDLIDSNVDLFLIDSLFGKPKESRSKQIELAKSYAEPQISPYDEQKVEEETLTVKFNDVDYSNEMGLFGGSYLIKNTEKFYIFFMPYHYGSIDNLFPQYVIEIPNTKENGLGIPLPSGVIRYYANDIPVRVVSVSKTPVDGTMKINFGNSWNVYGKMVLLDRKGGKDEEFWKYKFYVKNVKDERVKIKLVIKTYYNNLVKFSVSPSDIKVEKFGDRIQFIFPLNKGEEKEIIFSLNFKYLY